MRGTPMRRTFAGLFGLLFAVSGLARELVSSCPQHGGVHEQVGDHSTTSTALAATTSAPDPHAAHAGPHVAATSADRSGDGSTESASPGTSRDADHGSHCDCIGDCCGCATVRLDGEPLLAIAVDAPIVTPRLARTVADRPAARVDIALPFATAPPTTHAT